LLRSQRPSRENATTLQLRSVGCTVKERVLADVTQRWHVDVLLPPADGCTPLSSSCLTVLMEYSMIEVQGNAQGF
jgi:hypothetical protein